jgi:glycosyltransferase 2 family protein
VNTHFASSAHRSFRRASNHAFRFEHAPRKATFAAWLIALLVFGAFVGLLLHISELEKLSQLLRHIHPIWLMAALGLQTLTYFCAAAVWYVALKRRAHGVTTSTLVPVALAMLFINQAFPTGGLSGSLIVVRALRKRRVAANVVMGALVIGLMTTYLAYLLAVVVSLVLLLVYYEVSRWLVVLTALFAIAAVGIPSAVVWYRESMAPRMQTRLRRVPGVGSLLDAVGSIPTKLLHDPRLLARAIAFQLIEISLDAATLYVLLIAIGTAAAPGGAFVSFVMAFAVAQLIPVPLGLGTFEAALVGMLRLVGIPLEPAFTATLLFRGFTMWLPMVPGVWFARRELRPRRRRYGT